MEIKNVDGSVIVVLNAGDKLKIKTATAYGTAIKVDCDGTTVNISGGSEIINSISGNRMIEKFVFPSVIPSDEILKKCDRWIEMFKQTHDKFKELVLSDKYRDEELIMELSFSRFFSVEESTIRGNRIDLEIRYLSTTIQEGVTVSVGEENKDVFAYLLANVLDYYVSNNYKGSSISYEDDICNKGFIYSNESKLDIPIVADLSVLKDNVTYNSIVTQIIEAHNVNASTDQIIFNLRRNIIDQSLGEEFDNSLAYSEEQFAHIVEKASVRKKGGK